MITPILCPICQKPATDPSKSPFCTERCRKIDFFRWWGGKYKITEQLNVSDLIQLQEDSASPPEHFGQANDYE